MAKWGFEEEDVVEGKIKTLFVTNDDTDLENGWTIRTKARAFSPEFWQECDDEYGKGFITKAVLIDEDTYDWIGDIVWR